MSRELGNLGENEAVSLLVANGYKVIARNFQTRQGEIDIIAFDGKTLVFVEVKMRKNDKYGTPAEFINSTKVEKILKAAKQYIFENEMADIDWRLDAVVINKESNQSELIKNYYIQGLN
jgi:putative endonuclease